MGFLFNLRKPRKFNVKYRFYDEQKERIRESEARVRKKMGIEAEGDEKYHALHRGVFRDSVEDSRSEKNRNVRFGIILGVLLILLYALFHYAG